MSRDDGRVNVSSRRVWSSEEDEVLISILVESQGVEFLRHGTGLQQDKWAAFADELNDDCQNEKHRRTGAALHNRLDNIRNETRIGRSLRSILKRLGHELPAWIDPEELDPVGALVFASDVVTQALELRDRKIREIIDAAEKTEEKLIRRNGELQSVVASQQKTIDEMAARFSSAVGNAIADIIGKPVNPELFERKP